MASTGALAAPIAWLSLSPDKRYRVAGRIANTLRASQEERRLPNRVLARIAPEDVEAFANEHAAGRDALQFSEAVQGALIAAFEGASPPIDIFPHASVDMDASDGSDDSARATKTEGFPGVMGVRAGAEPDAPVETRAEASLSTDEQPEGFDRGRLSRAVEADAAAAPEVFPRPNPVARAASSEGGATGRMAAARLNKPTEPPGRPAPRVLTEAEWDGVTTIAAEPEPEPALLRDHDPETLVRAALAHLETHAYASPGSDAKAYERAPGWYERRASAEGEGQLSLSPLEAEPSTGAPPPPLRSPPRAHVALGATEAGRRGGARAGDASYAFDPDRVPRRYAPPVDALARRAGVGWVTRLRAHAVGIAALGGLVAVAGTFARPLYASYAVVGAGAVLAFAGFYLLLMGGR